MRIGILGDVHEEGIKILKEKKFELLNITNFDKSNLKNELANVDGIILRTSNLDSDILSHCNKLKIISRHGVGYDNVDKNFLLNNKIALAITSTSNAVSVAEHVMTMFLTLTKNIYKSDELVKSGNFNEKSELPNFFELYKKNILILGFGRIGKELAKRCLAFDSSVFVYDPYVPKEVIERHGCIEIGKENGFKEADYISIHLPLNEETKDFISFKEFNKFKNNLILVNTARGGIINQDALYDALLHKKILAAGLDVFEVEPPQKDLNLFNLENILLTPHNAALTLECRKRMAIECCENVYYFFKDLEKLNKKNIVDLKKN